MGYITLHKTLGVNPRMTFCPRCHKDGNELILLGIHNFLAHCNDCDLNIIGGLRCPRCKRTDCVMLIRRLEDREKIPGSLCDECRAEDAAFAAEVGKGGVYWKCADCHQRGVIKASAPFAAEVRAAHGKDGKPLAGPCGVEFSKKDCPACGPNKVT